MFIKNRLILSIILLVFPFALYAVEIPLTKTLSSDGAATNTFAIVDMSKVLDNFPETQRKQKEFEKKVGEIEEKLKLKEEEVAKLQAEIDASRVTNRQEEKKTQPEPSMDGFILTESTQTAETAQDIEAEIEANQDDESAIIEKQNQDKAVSQEVDKSTSTASVIVDPKVLEEKKKELEEKSGELANLKEESNIEIQELHISFRQQVMGKIYVVLQELAGEEGIEIIVDKNNVLYGKPNIDLTQKLVDRLSGKK
ncbi:MAG: OmpH family outer membrane protein [bacterium]